MPNEQVTADATHRAVAISLVIKKSEFTMSTLLVVNVDLLRSTAHRQSHTSSKKVWQGGTLSSATFLSGPTGRGSERKVPQPPITAERPTTSLAGQHAVSGTSSSGSYLEEVVLEHSPETRRLLFRALDLGHKKHRKHCHMLC